MQPSKCPPLFFLRRQRGAARITAVALLVIGAPACGGRVNSVKEHPTSPKPDAGTRDVAPSHDAGVPAQDASVSTPTTPSMPDASLGHDASVRTVAEASTDAGRTPEASTDASTCSSTDPLTIAGDYVATDGTEYWLRKTVTATT